MLFTILHIFFIYMLQGYHGLLIDQLIHFHSVLPQSSQNIDNNFLSVKTNK